MRRSRRTEQPTEGQAELGIETRTSGAQDPVQEGLGAVRNDDWIGQPTMGDAYDRISTRIFRVDVLSEYEELEAALRFGKPASRAEYGELIDALDEATDNARRAHLILVNAKVALEGFELDQTIVMSDMRAQATNALEREKESGARKKAITEADVEAWMASNFADEWRSAAERRAKAKRMVEHLERLSDLWRTRCQALDTMVRTARRP